MYNFCLFLFGFGLCLLASEYMCKSVLLLCVTSVRALNFKSYTIGSFQLGFDCILPESTVQAFALTTMFIY